MAKEPPREHDLAYRELFSHPELVEDLLRYFVDEPWVHEIDFASLHRESEISMVRRRGKKVRDVVWSAHFQNRTLYIVILLEFQSRPHVLMAVREALYVGTLYEDLQKQQRHSPGGKLPLVLPIVLYNGDRPWRAAQSVEELVEEPPPGLAPYQLQMRFFLIDERRTPFTFSTGRRNTVAGLLALEQSQQVEQAVEAVLFLLNSLQEPKYESLRQAFKELILRVLTPTFAPLAEAFDHPGPEDPMTIGQRLQKWYDQQQATSRAEGVQEGIRKGRSEGMQEGIRKGRSEGRAEGQRRLLAKQLRLRFSRKLDAATEARLEQATPAQLDLWAERVLTAKSLEEIFDKS